MVKQVLVTAQGKARGGKISFSGKILFMVKLSSSWSHGKKVSEDLEERTSLSPLWSYSGIQDVVSPSNDSCSVLEYAE